MWPILLLETFRKCMIFVCRKAGRNHLALHAVIQAFIRGLSSMGHSSSFNQNLFESNVELIAIVVLVCSCVFDSQYLHIFHDKRN